MIILDGRVEGWQEAQERLDELLRRGVNLTPLLKEIGEQEVADALQSFEQEQAPDGTPWVPLKRRRGAILQDTGLLRSSIHYQIYGGVALKVGAGASYAAVHQLGSRHVPARPFFNAPADVLRNALEVLNAYF